MRWAHSKKAHGWVLAVSLFSMLSFGAAAQERGYEAVFGRRRAPEVRRTGQDQTYEEIFGKKKGSEAEKKPEPPVKPEPPMPEAPSVLMRPDAQDNKVALLPWQFANGTKSAQRMAQVFLGRIFAKANMVTVQNPGAIEAKSGSKEAKADLPSLETLYAVGEKMEARWVVAARASWHSRSIWVSLGPKTKSTCTLDLLLVDVKERKIALEARGVQMDSHAKESTLQTVGALLVAFGITAFSGGPKAPHEERAVQLALLKAIGPWVEPRITAATGQDAKSVILK